MNLLVVGGAGYIGAHMTRALLEEGLQPVVLDNLSTGYRDFVPRGVSFVKADCRSLQDLEGIFKKARFEAVMHFAAASLVGESVQNPMKYYDNNVYGFLNLLKVMLEYRVPYFIFSSTAAVYAGKGGTPIREEDPQEPSNPYGRSKGMIESILKDVSQTGAFSYAALRYFNACGAHPSGEVGEAHAPETHLIPNALKVASGARESLLIHGADYPTEDGTCVRDYVDVQDLCRAHLAALRRLADGMPSGAFNLGSGRGISVREIVRAAETVTGRRIPIEVGPRRPGDPARLVACPDQAKALLGWSPKQSIEDSIRAAWNWEIRRFHRETHPPHPLRSVPACAS